MESSMTFRNYSACAFAMILLCARALEAKTVTLTSPDNRTEVFLNMGDTVVVELTSGEVNGFRWVSHLPKASALTALNESIDPPDKTKRTARTSRFRFNAAMTGDVELALGFESAVKVPGAAPQDASAFSVKIHVASGAPRAGTAVLIGVYKGMLPCADCSGLDTTLRLYAKGKYDTTYTFYVRSQTYRDAPHGDLTLSDRGDWTVLRGDAINPDATVYQLNPDDEQRSDSWLVKDQGAALVQLDREQRPIETKMNLALRRVDQSQ
jgi:copper homeostasis protein (lipoprotein)